MFCLYFGRSRYSSVGIVTGYGKGKDFSLLHDVQTGSVAHEASCQMGTGVKRQGREADYSPPPSVEVKKEEALTPLPHTPFHDVVLN
jgi:hypothetical protein